MSNFKVVSVTISLDNDCIRKEDKKQYHEQEFEELNKYLSEGYQINREIKEVLNSKLFIVFILEKKA